MTHEELIKEAEDIVEEIDSLQFTGIQSIGMDSCQIYKETIQRLTEALKEKKG